MKTSYFSSTALKFSKSKLISIARKPPSWFALKHSIYYPLCPTWDLIMNYKSGKISSEQYTRIYYEQILNKLDAAKVYQELGDDSILICYEKSGEFCHRHIVGNWLMSNLGIIVNEL